MRPGTLREAGGRKQYTNATGVPKRSAAVTKTTTSATAEMFPESYSGL